VSDAVAAIRVGLPVVLPTDTVYGLACAADPAAPTERLYALKGREAAQPSALLAADVGALLDAVPELGDRELAVVRALVPGPYTLVMPNPARRFPWITGTSPAAIGVRVPNLPAAAAEVLAEVGCVVATSANLPGGPDPSCVEDIPLELREQVGAIVDVGALPGTPSTVVELTGAEPRVLREGAVPAAIALDLIASALA
jgi:L-threonylcarbamoyladenylate synthase